MVLAGATRARFERRRGKGGDGSCKRSKDEHGGYMSDAAEFDLPARLRIQFKPLLTVGHLSKLNGDSPCTESASGVPEQAR